MTDVAAVTRSDSIEIVIMIQEAIYTFKNINKPMYTAPNRKILSRRSISVCNSNLHLESVTERGQS